MDSNLQSCKPIICVLNLRDGVFGKTLRSRKGLNPTGNVKIYPHDTLQSITAKAKACFPDGFFWNEMKEPLRYQRSKEQPQHTLHVLSAETNIYTILSEIQKRYRKRYPDIEFTASLWVFGYWISKATTPPITPPLSCGVFSSYSSIPSHDLEATANLLGLRSYANSSNDFDDNIHPKKLTCEIPLNNNYHQSQRIIKFHHCPYRKSLENERVSFKRYRPFEESQMNSFEYDTKRIRMENEFVTIPAMLNGVLMPFKFHRSALKEALGLK
jgi:hypothetical protein